MLPHYDSRVSLNAHAVAKVAPCLSLSALEVRVLADLQKHSKHAKTAGASGEFDKHVSAVANVGQP